ncbi:MAG: type V CRISPR-associated protein Cas12d [Candidatus Nomurabacteria bacterium]|jgi:hypothetical protein|nr:type V CRISPR-associated protein Cas12d [Candidatus Nomurabacteria bacterium]
MKQKQRAGKRGYRLHDERIAYSGGEGSMRSIKYELVGADKQTITDAVVHDNLRLYGGLNLNDYLTSEETASLLDFWLTALSLGFMFSNQNSIEPEFLKYLGKPTAYEKVHNLLDENLKEIIDVDKFGEFIYKSNRGLEKKNIEQRKKLIYNLLNNNDDLAKIESIAEDFAKQLDEVEQFVAKQSVFGITAAELPGRTLSLSFALDPNFEIMKIEDRTEFLDKIIDFYKSKCDEAQTKRFLCIGDNGNYFNGLFGNLYESLRVGKIDEIVDFLSEVYEFENRNEIKKRLEMLKELVDEIDEPKLVNKWSDYRSDFNGTIESWYSNRESKQKETVEQLKECRKLLSEIYDELPKDCEIREGVLCETIEFIDTASVKIDRVFTNELDSYLATLRSDLNEYIQQNNEVELPKDCQKKLSKHIQSSPLFFGENKLALWQQLKSLKSLIRKEVEKLEEILRGSFDDTEINDKQVDMLAQLYNRIKTGGNSEVIAVLLAVEKELKVKFSDRTDRATFNLTGYERGNYKKLNIPQRIKVSQLRKLTKLDQLYEKVKNAPQNNFVLRDVTQLSKIVAAAVVRGSDREREVNLIHSNLNGYANLISKTEFISRYPVQAANGMQNLLAHNGAGRYFYKFDDKKFSNIEKQELIFAKQGNNFSVDDGVWTKQPQNVPALAVQSSRYQVQFLDWFFGKHSKKKSWLSAGGSFTIAEKTCRINWDGEEPKITDEQKDRLFVSQPFTLHSKEKRLVDVEKIKNRYIGVDIGEYGLAWSLIKINGNKVEQLESGFIADNQQQTLKADVKNLRDRQVRATFTSPDTKIARVRESLIGRYRNLLEDLAMRKNARLSFEYEVSGFETGGNRISKVYDSIKRGSVAKEDNKSENNRAWGKLTNDEFSWKAFETTAAGTSQFCTKCKKWSSLAVTDTVDYQLEEYEDGLFKVKLDDGEYVRVFAPKNKVGDKVKGKDGLKGMIYKAMRPNMDGAGMKIVEHKLGSAKFAELQKDFGPNTKRGNIGIYICPYIDCQHIADADLQAAFNIAVRGYLKDANPGRAKKSKEDRISAKWCCDEESKLEFEAVDIKI